MQVVPATEERLVRAITVTGTLAAEEQVTLSLKVTGRLAGPLRRSRQPRHAAARCSRGWCPPTSTCAQARPRRRCSRRARASACRRRATTTASTPRRRRWSARRKALLDEARLTRERIATFVERGISPKAELDSADAALQVADGRYQDALEEVRNRQAVLEQRRTELELARQEVRDSSLPSPLDGMVRERHVTAGQYLAAGSPVVTVVRMHPLRLRVAVPEREAHARPGRTRRCG